LFTTPIGSTSTAHQCAKPNRKPLTKLLPTETNKPPLNCGTSKVATSSGMDGQMVSEQVAMSPGIRIDTYRRAFAYVFAGKGAFADASQPSGVLLEKEVMGEEVNIRDMSCNRTLNRFGTGDEVTVQAGPEGIRFLLISGAPINKPVAWHGPIVMNTQAELRQAIRELNNGTFIKPVH